MLIQWRRTTRASLVPANKRDLGTSGFTPIGVGFTIYIDTTFVVLPNPRLIRDGGNMRSPPSRLSSARATWPSRHSSHGEAVPIQAAAFSESLVRFADALDAVLTVFSCTLYVLSTYTDGSQHGHSLSKYLTILEILISSGLLLLYFFRLWWSRAHGRLASAQLRSKLLLKPLERQLVSLRIFP